MSRLSKSEVERIKDRLTSLPEPNLSDPDNPEWTEEDFAKAEGPESMPPEMLAAFPRTAARLRGRPRKEAPKRAISLRLDPDVIDHFKATGDGWQARINAALRKAAGFSR